HRRRERDGAQRDQPDLHRPHRVHPRTLTGGRQRPHAAVASTAVTSRRPGVMRRATRRAYTTPGAGLWRPHNRSISLLTAAAHYIDGRRLSHCRPARWAGARRPRRDMAVRTWVGRFCVADGRVEEEGPWLTSVIRDRSDDEPDELYVLVEPLTPGAEEFSGQLVDVVSQLYRRDPLSLTGALTRSLRAAHEHLRDWNKRSLPEHRVGAGSTCLAIRGTDVYIGQVGPGVAYVRRANGEVRRYHAEQDDLSHALGLSEQFEPRLRRVSLDPGDLILAGSTQLEQVVPREHLERILAKGADDALPELYLLGRDRPNLAIVLISCFEEVPDEQPPGFLTRAGEERP